MIFLGALGIALWAFSVAELVCYFRAPLRLASLAFLPLGSPERIPLGPGARLSLASPGDTSGDYRTAIVPRLDLAGLPGPPKVKGKDFSLVLDTARQRAIVSLNFANRRGCGIALLRFSLRDNAVEIDKRFAPTPLVLVASPLVLPFCLRWVFHFDFSPGLLIITMLFVAVPIANVVIIRSRMKPGVSWAANEISARIQSLR